MSESKSKIIVDDDWKSKVEAEKKTAEQQTPQHPEESDRRMPPASFQGLLSTLTTQSLVSLGQIPDPYSGQPVVDLEVAKHFIDTIAILEEKTRGNLSDDEKSMLDDVLHQLRMAFVAIQKAMNQPEKSQGGIELP